MADKETDIQLVVGAVSDEVSAEQTGKDIVKGVMKGIGNKGYIKLPVEITKFKYPKRDEKAISGPRSIDYSKLQKAQDELISNWKKLSKKGFSSRDEDIFNTLKSYRNYQQAVKNQYDGNNDLKDKQVMQIRSIIGSQLTKYFTRLAPTRLNNGKKGSFMNLTSDSEFEKYAKSSIQRYKAAQTVGVDLSKSELTKEDRSKIIKVEKDLEKQALIDKTMAQRKYEQQHAKETLKAEQKALDKIKKEREETAKNAIPIPKSNKPLEDVALKSSDIKSLAEPRDYTPTRDDKKTNKRFYRELSRGVSRAVAGQFGSGINLGLRRSPMGGPFITQDSVEGVDKRGSFYGTNKAMSALYKEMPKIRRAEKRSLRLSRIRTGQAGEEDLATLREQDKKDAQENGRVYIDVGRNKNNLTDAEKSKGIAEAGLPELAKILGGIAHNRPDDTIKKFETYLDTITKLDLEGGTSNWDSIRKELDMTMAKFYNTRGTLGVAELPMKEGKIDPSIQIELDQVKATLKKMLEIFEDRLKGKAGQEAEELRQRREFVKIMGKAPEDSTSSEKRGSQFDRITAEMSKNQAGIKKLTNATMVAAGDEDLADSRESEILQETQNEIIADASTGFNTDQKALEMFSHQITTNRLLGEVKNLLSQIFNISGGKSGRGRGGNGGGNPPTAFNSANNADDSNSIGSYQSILLQITQHLKNIDINVGNILQSVINITGKVPTNLPAIIDGQGVKTHPVEKEPITDKTDYNRLHDEKVAREVEAERTAAEVHNWVQKYVEADRKKNAQQRLDEAARKGINQVDTSRVITPTAPESFWSRLQSALTRTVSESEADRIMKLNRAQQARMRAQRLEIFGENTGRNLTDTGDKASVKRTKQLFGWIYKNDGTNKELFQDVRLTPGFNKEETINTTKILDSLNRVLSGPEMFKAQTGGTLRNILGSFTGYIGMPSIEKSRAEAEGLNQVMANVRNEVLKLIQSIQAKEMSLKGMQEMGTAKFDSRGMITTDSSSAAQKTFIDLEEQKGVLRGALAEIQMIDAVVGSTGGKISQIVKKLGFVMPELMENNTILQNINAGLDKNGKALKFQTRTGEILNYSFQLMSRHIGQMVKNWLWMINPINLLKRAFQDFASYDVKWQRTMNVIKYNLRRIIKPFMEWLAQQIVNIIGLVNSLLKGIGSIFGKNWDLFDQDAANSEKIKENLEEASQVSAGFDELHDIGSDTSDSENSADNLLGEIYTPEWDGLNKALEKIGETVGNIIKTVQGWDFWDWLALAGAALLGFLALKTLINWFSGKNPLQSVANGFKVLQTTVGWAILIAAFALFTNTLKDFITTIGEMDPWAVVGALSTLAAGFGILVGAIILLSKWATSDWKALLGMSVLVGVFTGLTAVLIPFINTLKEVTSEQLLSGLLFFAGALMAVTVAVGALATIFTAIATTGIGLAALGILAGVLAVVALVIAAMADYIRAIGEAGEGIKSICEGIATVVESVGTQITKFTETVGTNIVNITDAVSNGIKTVLEPILAYLDKVTDKITDLAKVIAHEIGETIRTVIETTGDTIVRIIETLLDAIPRLLNSILNFAGRIGPAIETSVNSIMNSVTKLINFVISGVEYLINLVVTGINGIINSINSVSGYVGISIPNVQPVEIPRFYPQYEQGTNYVPNDGLAYLHQGEAVIPKKYNQPFEAGLTTEERNYMYQMIGTLRSLDNTMKQGISVNGQFVQRGSDLVAVVNKTNSRTGADLLSNVAYAR